MTRTSWWLLVCLLLPLAGRPSQVDTGSGWEAAFRIDDTRVVMIFTGGELYMPQRAFEPLLDQSTVKSRSQTHPRLVEIPADRVREIVAGRAQAGDAWTLDAGPAGRLSMTVERLVLGYRDCGEGWGVIAVVDPADAARFSALKDDVFVARRGRVPAPPAAGAPRLGPVSYTVNATRRRAIVALLEQARMREWPAVKAEVQNYTRETASGRQTFATRWRDLDRRLERGDATVTFDTQAFRLTPDGDPRIYVRARWMIGQTTVFAARVWLRAGRTLSVDDVDVAPARQMRMPEFDRRAIDADYLGAVLNVFDTDHNGIGEVLMPENGYESANFVVSEYSLVPGTPRREVVVYSNGC